MSEDTFKVLLGVTGGIAAYKACEILRGLQKRGCDVKVVLTENAAEFVSPLTFAALSGHAAKTTLFDDPEEPEEPIVHIDLAKESDLFLIAPCTGNVIAKIAHGIADDLLTTTALAMPNVGDIVIAAAMNVNMFENPATQGNIRTLKERGVKFIEPEDGLLACGDVGRGKLADVDDIVDATMRLLGDGPVRTPSPSARDLSGKKVMITAGPTVEPIDAVRSITNRSSGKMGYAIAAAALARGADVTLISGPVSIDAPAGANIIPVETAQEMLDAARTPFERSDVAVFCAAVADLRPKERFDRKLKKGSDDEALRTIELVENPDIIAMLSANKRPGQVVVGFAAETDDVIDNAKKKLVAKHADFIVANEVADDLAFGQDEEAVSLVSADGVIDLPIMDKRQIADRLWDEVLKSS